MTEPATKAGVLGERHVVIVGAGVGGLVSALLLANKGIRVTLLEMANAPGGKMRQIMVGGLPIDSGPTVFTMKWVFENIFNQVGRSLDEVLCLQPLDILARHAWRADHCQLDLYSDVERSAQAIAEFSSPAESQRFLGFCKKAAEVYHCLEGPYIRSSRPSLLNMASDLGARGLGTLASLGPFASLWQALGSHFKDPRLQQLFGRYATYCGASPWLAPATLMLVAHVELDGVWSVQGGMHALACALAQQAQQLGASIKYASPCRRILVRDGRTCGVELMHGETIAADAVIFNGDIGALAQGLLGEDVRASVPDFKRSRRSLSALTWSVNTRTSGFPLVRHNVFFDNDYAREFKDIFEHQRLPEQATVYVCAQDRNDSGCQPADSERLLCLVNAPALGDQKTFNSMEIEQCQEQSQKLMRQCGLDIDLSAAHMSITTPTDFNRLFPGTGGALYGTASHGWMTPFQRPSSLSRLPGLYLAGGSVHPGPGVPMAALSGQLAAETLMAHLDSTKPLRRVRISGGMSTPSAMTAVMR
jgi:1-hydroxycarotenoid 3,4-desaturase